MIPGSLICGVYLCDRTAAYEVVPPYDETVFRCEVHVDQTADAFKSATVRQIGGPR